jgi:betaine-aldehyde dehydrogenase
MRDWTKFFIAGNWQEPAGSETIQVVSPYTEQVIGACPAGSTTDMDRAVAAARTALESGGWSTTSPAQRADVLARACDIYANRSDEMAELITLEMGSPIAFSAFAQAPLPIMLLDYYADLARTFEFESTRDSALGPTIVRHEPVGVVAAIVPWNVPQCVTMSKVAPALAAGCTVVLKPAPETPLDAFLMAEIFQEAGLPPGVINVVPADRPVGEYLVSHPGVDKVAFTGSTAAGRRIASICGEQLKRVSLELGGKSAAIILDDADLDSTVTSLRMASFMNNGQACLAQTRILAPRHRYSEVVEALADLADSLQVGDPMDPATEIGPLVAARQRDRVEGYIRIGQDEGGKIVAGGGRPKSQPRGWFVEPTIFADISNSMRIAREEIFGPVLVVIPYDEDDEAVLIANDSDYGLAGSVFTSDKARGIEVARRVRTGTFGVNGYFPALNAPFGGYKASGLGREFGPEGLHHYLEAKSIYVEHALS